MWEGGRKGEGKQFNGEERSVEENKVSHPQPQQGRAEVVTHHSRRPEDLCRASSSSSEGPRQPRSRRRR